MFLLESKWLTFWTLEYTLIWLISLRLKIDFFKKFMNPGYLLFLIALGRLGIIMYQYLINKTRYEVSFFICDMLLHFIPLLLFQKYFKRDPNSLLFTILFVILYLLFINSTNKSIKQIYFGDKPVNSIKEFINKYFQTNNIYHNKN